MLKNFLIKLKLNIKITINIISQILEKVKKNSSTKGDKLRQRQAFRTKSAKRAATRTNRIFFTLTQLVYTAIVYKVVSVDPIITPAMIPDKTIDTRDFHNI